MSEASRQRRLFIDNILEELASRHGSPPEIPPDGVECAPSWGPVGSLARQLLSPEEFAHLVALDEERSPGMHAQLLQPPSPASPASPEPPKLTLAHALERLDQHGETALFECPACGEESAKASVLLGIWHCTACETNGHVSLPDRRLPPTRLHEL